MFSSIFALSKITFVAVFFIRYVCARYLIYRKTPKSVLFAVFLLKYLLCRLSLFAAYLIPVFICKFLCIYAVLKCIFMQYVMVNRKLCKNFGFSCMFEKMSYLITLCFFVRFIFGKNSRKRKQKRKSRFLVCFCRKTSLFVANKTLIFSDLCLYRVIYTPPPPFLALAGWVSSRPKFFIFYFLFFCKILRFLKFRFSTEF